MKRVASVIGLGTPDQARQYEDLHAAVWPGVLERLTRSRVTNYSIYRHGETLFSYFEYTGVDYDADMAGIAGDPITQQWWAVVNPLQRPLDGLAPGTWREIREVFHSD